jgi:hypothetical protein
MIVPVTCTCNQNFFTLYPYKRNAIGDERDVRCQISVSMSISMLPTIKFSHEVAPVQLDYEYLVLVPMIVAR